MDVRKGGWLNGPFMYVHFGFNKHKFVPNHFFSEIQFNLISEIKSLSKITDKPELLDIFSKCVFM